MYLLKVLAALPTWHLPSADLSYLDQQKADMLWLSCGFQIKLWGREGKEHSVEKVG